MAFSNIDMTPIAYPDLESKTIEELVTDIDERCSDDRLTETAIIWKSTLK
jgi:hypothetical protein